MCGSNHCVSHSQLVLDMRERVVMKMWKEKRHKLEDIPEETELRVDTQSHDAFEEVQVHLETDLEILRRAMDVGIWALCLGFGFMLSRNSIPRFRRPPPPF
ncbi:hypothetical protein Fmac_020545 [Flemingia macrophylla]|uniref:Uncharacterized protein n=1 Tax=Flemingia macrophylla TaxID=520843 RepID=A0ABD1LUA9_9FABA